MKRMVTTLILSDEMLTCGRDFLKGILKDYEFSNNPLF